MSTTTTNPAELAAADMADELTNCTHERDQADTKAAGMLAGVVGAVGAELAVLVAAPARLGPWGVVGILASAAVLVAAAGAFGLALRPAIAGEDAGRWGFVALARSTPDDVLTAYRERAEHPDQRAEARAVALVDQARRVRAKYLAVRRGVDLALVGLGLAVVTAVVTALVAALT